MFNCNPGKPAGLHEKTNPDWAPSMRMGYGVPVEEKDLTSRYNRAQARNKRKVMELEEDDIVEEEEEDKSENVDKSVCGKNTLDSSN